MVFGFFVFLTDDTLQKKVNCTACGKQVNQFLRNSVFEHPALKVLICKVEMDNSPFFVLLTSTSISFYICQTQLPEWSLLSPSVLLQLLH